MTMTLVPPRTTCLATREWCPHHCIHRRLEQRQEKTTRGALLLLLRTRMEGEVGLAAQRCWINASLMLVDVVVSIVGTWKGVAKGKTLSVLRSP